MLNARLPQSLKRAWEKYSKVIPMNNENDLKCFVDRLRNIVDDFESGPMRRESAVNKKPFVDDEGKGQSPNKPQDKVCFSSLEEARRRICPCNEEKTPKETNEDPEEEPTSDDSEEE